MLRLPHQSETFVSKGASKVSKIRKVSIILLFCVLPLLMISACTPPQPETAATIIVQRPTFTSTPSQPTRTATSTETALATPTQPTIATYTPTATTPSPTATPPPNNPDEADIPMPHWTGPTGPAYTPLPTPTPPFGLIAWPPECTPPAQLNADWLPCQVEPLPDERWIILHYGPEICGSGQQRRLINLLTQEIQYLGMGSVFAALPNGKVIFNFAYCSAGHRSLFDPDTGEMTRLGWSGRTIWNEAHTAFVVEVIHLFMPGSLWGYNVEINELFLPEVEGNQVNDGAVWTPDGSHVLYQETIITHTDSYTFTATPREIYRVNAYTGEKQVIASDPQFHYFLCSEPCTWDGDWVPVRRITYYPEEYFANGSTNDPDLNCLLEGRGCPGEQTFWQLNWHTGELRPPQ
jgi:hypothetical protein